MAVAPTSFSIANDPMPALELRSDDAVYLLFNSIHRVLRVEKLLTAAEVPFRLASTPRPLFSDCGLSIIVAADRFLPACALFNDSAVKLEYAFARREKKFIPLSGIRGE